MQNPEENRHGRKYGRDADPDPALEIEKPAGGIATVVDGGDPQEQGREAEEEKTNGAHCCVDDDDSPRGWPMTAQLHGREATRASRSIQSPS